MSHPRENRIELLRLAKPDVSMPDIGLWIARARELEAYVDGDGPPLAGPSKAVTEGQAKSPDNPPRKGGPARK